MPPRKKAKGGLSAEEIEKLLLDEDDVNDLYEILCEEEGNWAGDEGDVELGDSDEHEQPAIRIVEEQVITGDIDNSHPARSRRIQSLEDALNIENYDVFELPQTEIKYNTVLQKKTNDSPEKTIEWSNIKKTTVGRQGRQNIIVTPGPAVLGEGRNAKTEREAWELFFPKESISDIVRLTNQSVTKLLDALGETRVKEIQKKNPQVKIITEEEFYAFIGLNYARGVFQQNLWAVNRCFQESIGHPIFGATIYKFILKHLTFDDKDTRSERWKYDRLAAIR